MFSNDARYDSAQAIVGPTLNLCPASRHLGEPGAITRVHTLLLGPARQVSGAAVPGGRLRGGCAAHGSPGRGGAWRRAVQQGNGAGARGQAGGAAVRCSRRAAAVPRRYFDLVASIGVMEHFVDDVAASSEISRVLREDGRYMVLIHVALMGWQSLQQKIAEYVFPRPRPVLLAKWFFGKFYRPIRQPVQNRYTIASAGACLERSGFEVTEVIHRGNTPGAPLVGPHVIIYVCRKAPRVSGHARANP